MGGPISVVRWTRIPGTHRVNNFTVEHEHVYDVGRLGRLVHNQDCDAGGDNNAGGGDAGDGDPAPGSTGDADDGDAARAAQNAEDIANSETVVERLKELDGMEKEARAKGQDDLVEETRDARQGLQDWLDVM